MAGSNNNNRYVSTDDKIKIFLGLIHKNQPLLTKVTTLFVTPTSSTVPRYVVYTSIYPED